MNERRPRVICFDAVGTLIHPEPSAVVVYADVGQRLGSRLDVKVIRQSFAAAFARQDLVDRANGWKASEQREIERWRTIVAEVLHDVVDKGACFRALYEHFQQPGNWRCDAAAGRVVEALTRRGYRVGLASNFDHRLRQVLHGFPQLAMLEPIVISSEVGWRKPAPAFFDALRQTPGVAAEELLYIGDDLPNDYEGAIGAGCRALLFTAGEPGPPHVAWVANLAEVLDKVI
jgi:putative hydrolase of the HAD superfamily